MDRRAVAGQIPAAQVQPRIRRALTGAIGVRVVIEVDPPPATTRRDGTETHRPLGFRRCGAVGLGRHAIRLRIGTSSAPAPGHVAAAPCARP
ncbi:MAG: hypothetical protein BGO26_04405 [Actinobacteria bacterium 69-20]|nr:MAG: hypothetical protein BGO26_04405 [Actinobacteria bacterium 69-20]